MSAEIICLQTKLRPVPVDDPVTSLRKAIAACVHARGAKTTALIIAKEFEIPERFDWRTRARNLITGEKS